MLTGRELVLPSVPTLWLGDPDSHARVAADLPGFRILSATDRRAEAHVPAQMAQDQLGVLRARIAERPWAYAAMVAPPASFAPCVGDGETLEPNPVCLRLFLVFDGTAWRPLPGGLAQITEAADLLGGRLPHSAVCKDVWVLQEEGLDIYGPANLPVPPLQLRRTQGRHAQPGGGQFLLARPLPRAAGRTRQG